MQITIFLKNAVLARGKPGDFGEDVRQAAAQAETGDMLAFDDESGAQIDLVLALHPVPRQRGRPALGVEAREVTLLPRHWEWLANQPGGASVTLRKLVEAARLSGRSEREFRNAACRFLSVMAGDLPGYEEGTRALYAGDRRRFDDEAARWPKAVADHARSLAWPS